MSTNSAAPAWVTQTVSGVLPTYFLMNLWPVRPSWCRPWPRPRTHSLAWWLLPSSRRLTWRRGSRRSPHATGPRSPHCSSRNPARTSVLKSFTADLADIRDVLHAITLVRQAGERSRDLISGYGELWSSRLLAAYLTERGRSSSGSRPVHWVDARELIVIERGEMGPAVQWDESRANARRIFTDATSGIAVVTGFIASERNGLPTTLGRNGSDFSASIVGALLERGRRSRSGRTSTAS